ncbi:MAG: anti-sigma factor domain-containing protein [Prosthecobacter sp.]
MDERHEELAALNALIMLESDEKRVLDGTTLADRELRDLVTDMENVAAQLGHLIVPVEPPSNMKRRIREKIRARGGRRFAPSAGAVIGTLGWALAAALAVAAVWLWNDRSRLTQDLAAASKILTAVIPVANQAEKAEKPPVRSLEDELKKLQSGFDEKQAALRAELETARLKETEAQAKAAQLTTEVETLKKQADEFKMEMTTLQSTVWEYRRSTMMIVWDGKSHQGVVMLDKMPKVESGKDYQLWVVDPAKPAPVSAGVVTVDAKGATKTNFKPLEEVGEGVKFALSVEDKGGVAQKKGLTVFAGP